MIRPVQPSDAAALARIYNHYVEHTTITFEEEPVTSEEMARRITEVTARYPWFVWEDAGTVQGYAYGRAYHARSAFRYTVETAIYLDHEATGRGIGGRLYPHLLDALAQGGFHLAIGAIALPNEASARLHERCGFERAGHLREAGWKFEQWIDVGYWQKALTPR